MESPGFGLRRYFFANTAAHPVAVFEETLQRHIAQAANGGIRTLARREPRGSVFRKR